jgi:hypothetical protein
MQRWACVQPRLTIPPLPKHQTHSHQSKSTGTLRLDKGACYRLLITPADTSMPCDNLFGKSVLLFGSCSIACEECFNVAAWHVRSQLIAHVLTGLSFLFSHSNKIARARVSKGYCLDLRRSARAAFPTESPLPKDKEKTVEMVENWFMSESCGKIGVNKVLSIFALEIEPRMCR